MLLNHLIRMIPRTPSKPEQDEDMTIFWQAVEEHQLRRFNIFFYKRPTWADKSIILRQKNFFVEEHFYLEKLSVLINLTSKKLFLSVFCLHWGFFGRCDKICKNVISCLFEVQSDASVWYWVIDEPANATKPLWIWERPSRPLTVTETLGFLRWPSYPKQC